MACGVTRALSMVLVLSLAGQALAMDWPHWRGPFLNGSTQERGVPDSWSLTDNVGWVASLPGPSAATPIISKGKVFISSTVKNGPDLVALCFDAGTGRELWRKKLGESTRQVPRNTMATPSPAADGQRVCFLYGSGQLAGLDFDGNILWARNIEAEYGSISCQFGYGASPLIHDGRLFVFVQRRDKAWREPINKEPLESFLLAVNPATGENLWKHRRITDALNESLDSYASPIAYENAGRAEVIVTGGDYVTAHEPQTGNELWRYGYASEKSTRWRLIPSIVTGEGLIFGVQPRGGNQLFALKAGGAGTLSKDHVAWTFEGPTPDVSTPLYYGGNLYVLDGVERNATVTCFEPQTGRVKWQGRIGDGPWRASLTAADGKIYCINEDAEAIVLAANDTEIKIISRVDMQDRPVQASVAIADGHLFIRTASKLFCISRSAQQKSGD
jgi:outer membrane protein assembly factor BamB